MNALGLSTENNVKGDEMRNVWLSLLLVLMVGCLVWAEPYMKYPLRPVRRGTGYTTKYAFDFGKKNSTVREGFKPVTLETVLSGQAEYGWRDAKNIKQYYTRDDYKWKSFPVDILYSPYQALALNDLNDDCLWGTAPAELHLRLPEGKYNVYYMGGVPRRGGFPSYQYFKFDISLNDQVKDTICIPFSTMFENRRYTVDSAMPKPPFR